jgi:DNA-binding PadR family transcriptional regulator
MPKSDPERELPLSSAVLHILLVLADGERHGYAIAQEVESLTAGRIRMGPGTLYGSIQRMTASALVERAPRRPRADQDDERRRYYRITGHGQRVLELELQRLGAVVAIARRRRLLRTPEPA